MLRKSKEKSQIIFHPIDKKSKYCWWSFKSRSMRNRPISIANGILRLEISVCKHPLFLNSFAGFPETTDICSTFFTTMLPAAITPHSYNTTTGKNHSLSRYPYIILHFQSIIFRLPIRRFYIM